jgi:hypothetical protein
MMVIYTYIPTLSIDLSTTASPQKIQSAMKITTTTTTVAWMAAFHLVGWIPATTKGVVEALEDNSSFQQLDSDRRRVDDRDTSTTSFSPSSSSASSSRRRSSSDNSAAASMVIQLESCPVCSFALAATTAKDTNNIPPSSSPSSNNSLGAFMSRWFQFSLWRQNRPPDQNHQNDVTENSNDSNNYNHRMDLEDVEEIPVEWLIPAIQQASLDLTIMAETIRRYDTTYRPMPNSTTTTTTTMNGTASSNLLFPSLVSSITDYSASNIEAVVALLDLMVDILMTTPTPSTTTTTTTTTASITIPTTHFQCMVETIHDFITQNTFPHLIFMSETLQTTTWNSVNRSRTSVWTDGNTSITNDPLELEDNSTSTTNHIPAVRATCTRSTNARFRNATTTWSHHLVTKKVTFLQRTAAVEMSTRTGSGGGTVVQADFLGGILQVQHDIMATMLAFDIDALVRVGEFLIALPLILVIKSIQLFCSIPDSIQGIASGIIVTVFTLLALLARILVATTDEWSSPVAVVGTSIIRDTPFDGMLQYFQTNQYDPDRMNTPPPTMSTDEVECALQALSCQHGVLAGLVHPFG